MEVVPTSITGIDDLISITSEALDAGPDYDMDGDKGNDLAAYEAKTNDIIATINAIVDSKDIVPKDLKFDDSIMPQAPNYYEWVIDANFLGSDMPPYLEQALIGIKLFAEYCPECSDLGWMDDNGHKPTDGLATFELKVTLLEYGVCPKCGARRSQLIKDGKLNFYNELAVNAGQRSGKSALVAMLSTYITHRMLKAQKPSQIFDVKSNTLFHGTFVALTFAQAKDSLWDPYYIYLLESPWFKAYHALLRKYERKFNTEIFKLKDTFVQYRHRQLMVYPAGPDTRTLRGRTRIFGAIDELGWFDNEKDSTKVKMNASGVYAAMGNSFRTVRTSETRQIAMGYDEALTGYFMNVSSPSSQRDKICELVRQSKHSKKLLGLHKPTWEMNPNITRESLQEDYDRDPIVAERDFGAAPPLSASPFINNKESIINCMKTRGRNFVTYNFYTYKSSEGKHFRYAIVDNIKASDTRSCLAFDAGLTNNSFSIACGSLQTWEVQGRELEIPCMDLLVEINPAPGVPLHYTKIFDGVLNPIIEKRNVSVFLADRWNSTKILQDAEMMHESVEVARQYSLKYVDMGNTKRALEDEEFRIPRSSNEKFDFERDILQFNHMSYPKCFEHRPVEHLILQLVTVQDTGKTVLKGDGLTDDLWRATSLCHWGLIQDEYQDFLSKPVSMTQKKGALGISKLGSGSAPGISSGSKGQVAGSVRTRGRN